MSGLSDKEFDFDLEDIIAEFNDYTVPEPRKRRRRTPVPAAETAVPPQAEPTPQQPVYEEPAHEETPVIQEDQVPPAEEPPVVEIVHAPKHAAPAKEPEPEKVTAAPPAPAVSKTPCRSSLRRRGRSPPKSPERKAWASASAWAC